MCGCMRDAVRNRYHLSCMCIWCACFGIFNSPYLFWPYKRAVSLSQPYPPLFFTLKIGCAFDLGHHLATGVLVYWNHCWPFFYANVASTFHKRAYAQAHICMSVVYWVWIWVCVCVSMQIHIISVSVLVFPANYFHQRNLQSDPIFMQRTNVSFSISLF